MPALILASSPSNDELRPAAVLLVAGPEEGVEGFAEHDDNASAAAPAMAPPSTTRRGTSGATIGGFAGVTVAEG